MYIYIYALNFFYIEINQYGRGEGVQELAMMYISWPYEIGFLAAVLWLLSTACSNT